MGWPFNQRNYQFAQWRRWSIGKPLVCRGMAFRMQRMYRLSWWLPLRSFTFYPKGQERQKRRTSPLQTTYGSRSAPQSTGSGSSTLPKQQRKMGRICRLVGWTSIRDLYRSARWWRRYFIAQISHYRTHHQKHWWRRQQTIWFPVWKQTWIQNNHWRFVWKVQQRILELC